MSGSLRLASLRGTQLLVPPRAGLGALILILMPGATARSAKHRFDTQLAGRHVADHRLRSAPVQRSETKSPMLGSTREPLLWGAMRRRNRRFFQG